MSGPVTKQKKCHLGYLDEFVCVVILRHGFVLRTDEVCLPKLRLNTVETKVHVCVLSDLFKEPRAAPRLSILLVITRKGHRGKMILGYRATKAECRSFGKLKPSSWYDLTLDQTSSAHNLGARLALPVVSNSL